MANIINMNPTLRNILGFIAGLITGNVVNMIIIIAGTAIVGLPEGVEPMDPESIKANMDAFEVKHFLVPLLAHALGTLIGVFVGAKIMVGSKMPWCLVLGALFLAAGIWNVMDMGGPDWFNITDLIVAYIPMAWLGYKWGK